MQSDSLSTSHQGSTSRGESSRMSFGQNASVASKLETAIFSVLYTMVKDNVPTKPIFSLLLVFIDTIQILGFVFSKDTDWGSPMAQDVARTASSPFALVGATVFFVMFAVVSTAVLLSLLNFLFVARDVKGGELSMMWPVKTLRFLCTLNVTIFYMPILSTLLVPLSCRKLNDGSVVLRDFADLECWGATTTGPGVAAILLMVAFIPGCLVFRLIYFQPNPIAGDPVARPLARVETLWLLCKTLLVLIFRLTQNGTAQAVVLMVLAGIMAICQLSFFPFYKKSTNNLYAFACGVDLGAALSMLLVASARLAPLAALLTAIPMMIACGAIVCILSELRWRAVLKRARMTVVTLQEERNATDELLVDRPGILANIENGARRTFASSSDVQLMARVLLNSKGLTEELGEGLEVLYTTAMEYFPRDAALCVSYARYLKHYRGNNELAVMQYRAAAKMRPPYDVRFLAYCAERQAFEDNKSKMIGEGRLDVLTILEFQKMYNTTMRYHSQTLKKMKGFWKMLLLDSINIGELRQVTEDIAVSEQKASAAYRKMIKMFPNNKQIYRSAASFMADVHHDYEMAQYYADQADELEDGHEGSRSSRTNTYAAANDIDEQTLAEYKGYRESLQNNKSAAVERLSVIILVSLALLCALSIANYVVMYQMITFYDQSLDIMAASGERRFLLQSGLAHASRMVLANENNNTEKFDDARAELYRQMRLFETTNKNLYRLSYGEVNEMVDKEWTTRKITFFSGSENASTFQTNQKDAASTYVVMALKVAELDMGRLRENPEAFDSHFENGYGEILTPHQQGLPSDTSLDDPNLSESFEFTAYQCSGKTRDDVTITLLTEVGMFLLAAGMIVCLGVCLFRPALNAVRQERLDTFSLFLTIPKSVVQEVHDDMADGENLLKNKRAEGKKKKSKKGTTAVEAETTTRANSDSVDKRFRYKYWGALVSIGVMFLITLIVTVVYLLKTQDTAVLLNNSSRRTFLVARTFFYANVLIPIAHGQRLVAAIDDPTGYDRLVGLFRRDIDLLAYVNQIVVNGGVDFDNRRIHGIRNRNDQQTQLMDEEACMFNNPPCEGDVNVEFRGLDSIFQFYMTSSRNLADVPMEVMKERSIVLPLQNMERVQPRVLSGLMQSTQLIIERARSLSDNGQINAAVLMAATLLCMVLLYAFLFRPLVASLREESYRSSAMLLMIPPTTISEVDAIRTFLETGTVPGLDKSLSGEAVIENALEERNAREKLAEHSSSANATNGKAEDPVPGSPGYAGSVLKDLGLPFCAVDAASTVIDVSKQLLTITGFDREDVVGQSIAKLFAVDSGAQKKQRLEKALQETLSTVVGDPMEESVIGVSPSLVNLHEILVKDFFSGDFKKNPHPPVKLAQKGGTAVAGEYELRLSRTTFEEKVPAVVAYFKRKHSAFSDESNYSDGETMSDESETTAFAYSKRGSRHFLSLTPALSTRPSSTNSVVLKKPVASSPALGCSGDTELMMGTSLNSMQPSAKSEATTPMSRSWANMSLNGSASHDAKVPLLRPLRRGRGTAVAPQPTMASASSPAEETGRKN